MAVLPNTPTNYFAQTANGQVYLSWNTVAGATGYTVQRSTDSVNYTTLATPTINNYLDTAVIIGNHEIGGTQYWYQVAATNTSGSSQYTLPQSVIPTVAGQLSLADIRLASQQMADRVNSNFVTLPEWTRFINLAADELYDLITSVFEDYGVYRPVYFTTNGSDSTYPLPDGITTFTTASGETIVPPPIYKLAGVDLGLNNAPNGFVTVSKYNFIDRNRYVFPNTASTIYGVFGLQYRFIGNRIRFIPQPSSQQPIGIWYVPRNVQLLRDTDIADGYNGWLRYVIVRAAKYALDKEESDTSKLETEIVFLKQRIEEMAPNRDEGQPDTISDTRSASGFGPDGSGGWWGGPTGQGF